MTYRVDLSNDDALCNAVVAALNERKISPRLTLFFGKELYSNRLGERFPSLYQNPMFVTWMRHALTKRDGSFWEPVEWLAIPLYNDGRDVAVVRVTFPGSYSASHSLIVFEDVARFKVREWRDIPQLLADQNGLHLQERGITPNYTPLPLVPPELRGTLGWRLLHPKIQMILPSGLTEFNLIRFAGRIYVFLRAPTQEVAVVSEVHRDRSSKSLCFIGSGEDSWEWELK